MSGGGESPERVPGQGLGESSGIQAALSCGHGCLPVACVLVERALLGARCEHLSSFPGRFQEAATNKAWGLENNLDGTVFALSVGFLPDYLASGRFPEYFGFSTLGHRFPKWI